MKQLIKDVLDDMSTGQINLSSSSTRELIAITITAALKTKGCYTEYDDYELDEQEARASWVCTICGKNTFEVDSDYIGSGANHLSCEIRLEQDKNYRKKNWSQKKHENKVFDEYVEDIDEQAYAQGQENSKDDLDLLKYAHANNLLIISNDRYEKEIAALTDKNEQEMCTY